jgi:hypothetical protein
MKRFCCRECKSKKYRQTHRKKCGEYQKKFRENNKEKIKGYRRKYYRKHKEEILKHQQTHRLDNIDKIKLRDNEYSRTHKKEQAIAAKKRIKKFKLKWYSKLFCDFCGSEKSLDFHHINLETKRDAVARLKHKTNQEILSEIAKCIVLCHSCHTKYHAKLRRREKQFVLSL